MKKSNLKRNIVLSILFFLPVAFLLMLYPAKHNYIPLDVINNNVLDITNFTSNSKNSLQLKDHITVLGFFGKEPLKNNIVASNLKELVYDKFKGFKKFQLIIIMPDGTQEEVAKLKKEIATYEDLRFWNYVYATEPEIKAFHKNLKIESPLKDDLSTNDVFIIDKDLNQRGRLDDRTETQIEDKKTIKQLNAYNCIEISVIKNKMSEDMRILFTEYRQKRKGKFNSTSRRADDLKS